MPGNSVNLHILPWPQSQITRSEPKACHTPLGSNWLISIPLGSRFTLVKANFTVTILPQEEAGPSFPEHENFLFFSSPPTSLGASLWMWNSDGLMRSRHWSLWTWSIFKWAMRTWTVYRFWKNEIRGEKRKFDTYRETDLWSWEKLRERKY